VKTHASTTAQRRGPRRRWTTLLLYAAGAVGIASTAIGGSLAAAATPSPARPTVIPVRDIVGSGLITCKVATGEVGYSPASKAGAAGPLTVSIWFQASRCSRASSTATPVPATVTGAMSFVRKNGCPLLSPPVLGTGTLNLSYNNPPVPRIMIDPSVGQTVTVTQVGPYWVLKGALIGSYPSTTFVAWLKPEAFAGQNCKTGITSEYITRDQTPFVFHI